MPQNLWSIIKANIIWCVKEKLIFCAISQLSNFGKITALTFFVFAFCFKVKIIRLLK